MGNGTYITEIFSWLTLLADVAVILFVVCLIVRGGAADRIVIWVGRRAVGLMFLCSLVAFGGSLLFSEFAGFLPCMLCWVQRTFLYPQVVLFGLAWMWKDRRIISYGLVLSVLGGIVALYHSFTNLGGHSFLPCTAAGSECAKIYVLEFGYITIPMMALTTFALLIVIALAARRTEKLSRV